MCSWFRKEQYYPKLTCSTGKGQPGSNPPARQESLREEIRILFRIAKQALYSQTPFLAGLE